MKLPPYVSVVETTKKEDHIEYKFRVRRWLMFPLFWQAYREGSRGCGVIVYVAGFFYTLFEFIKFVLKVTPSGVKDVYIIKLNRDKVNHED